jgi:hypothetical protein
MPTNKTPGASSKWSHQEIASSATNKNDFELPVMITAQSLAIENTLVSSLRSQSSARMKVPASIQCFIAALVITLAQIAVAVCVAAPSEWPLGDRYVGLIQHDSYWFANIVNRGYGTTVPPMDHKVMEVSNVAFFPAYPLLSTFVGSIFHLNAYHALLVTSQLAAFGFWFYFFLFCERWKLSPALRFFGAVAIVAHPAAFYLIAGYSESLFLMTLVGFIYWSGAEGRGARVLAAAHGFVMSATRIVGIPCALYPVVRAVFENGWQGLRDVRGWTRRYGSTVAVSVGAMLGAISFFIYCQLRWSRWDMYMLTQEAGWAIKPDYLAFFKPANYRWVLPPLNDTAVASQLTTSIALVLFGVITLCELLPAIRRRTAFATRAGIYFCALVIFYIALAGVASVQMESMLRYEFCVHALIVLALLHYLHQFRLPPVLVRAFGMAAVALLGAAGLSLQGWYVWNFTRGYWVA